MKQIHEAGTRVDYQRRAHKREDTRPWQLTINRVRRWIFEGKNMASKPVKAPLKERSQFPIQVSTTILHVQRDTYYHPAERVLQIFDRTRQRLLRTLHT